MFSNFVEIPFYYSAIIQHVQCVQWYKLCSVHMYKHLIVGKVLFIFGLWFILRCDFSQINAPPPPRSPPPTSSRSSSSRGGGASNASTCPLTRSDDTLCQLPPEIPREHLSVVQTLTKTHFGEVSNKIASMGNLYTVKK